jgi:nicotinamide-nucleotide amidase
LDVLNPPAYDLSAFESAAAPLAKALTARRWMLATAESCTGGLIGGVCTSLAGSSNWFERGFVTYSNESKTQLLGVPAEMLAKRGAVNRETAEAMALGALSGSNAQLSIAVTGIAGPGGGSANKPVGTVWMAVASRDASGNAVARSERQQFAGDRAEVRGRTVVRALEMALEMARAV